MSMRETRQGASSQTLVDAYVHAHLYMYTLFYASIDAGRALQKPPAPYVGDEQRPRSAGTNAIQQGIGAC